VSPQLRRRICEEQINKEYLGHLAELDKKLDHLTQQIDLQNLPSCMQSKQELEQLRTKAVARIKEFLVQRMTALKIPNEVQRIDKLSIQVLAEHHAAVAHEVKLH